LERKREIKRVDLKECVESIRVAAAHEFEELAAANPQSAYLRLRLRLLTGGQPKPAEILSSLFGREIEIPPYRLRRFACEDEPKAASATS
jgi:hypothetical protein